MGHPYVLGGATFHYEDMRFHSQPYSELEDGFGDSNMTYIDPDLHNLSPRPYDNTWAAPAQQLFKENPATFFVVDPARQVPSHAPVRPAVGISPVPQSYARFGSPFSSTELSPSGSVLSPAADTEGGFDRPRTPPDANLASPFEAPLPLEPFAHAIQFSGMGPDYVNPSDVNPSQQLEYCESDNGIIDFNFAPQPGYFDSQASQASRDIQSAHGTALLEFTAGQPVLAQTRSTVKAGIKAESQYPPLDDDMGSEEEHPSRQQHDDDGDYQPSKRQRTTPRTAARRGAKTTIAGTTSPARRTRNRGVNPAAPPRSCPPSSSSKARLNCPDCKQRAFSSQAELDAHIKKEHRRPFSCVFDFAGCASTFGSKNEWKRHVATQHLLLFYWVCTEGTCSKAQNSSSSLQAKENPHGAIFNRKDLFTQHLKRMHAPKEIKDLAQPAGAASKRTATNTTKTNNSSSQANPQAAALVTQWAARLKLLQETAVRPRCHLPTLMRCPVAGCAAPPFRGADAWNQRMEHVAKHMDGAPNPGQSQSQSQASASATAQAGSKALDDPTLVKWASSPEVGIIVEDGAGGWVLRNPLERGAGGNSVVVTVPAPARAAAPVGRGGLAEEVEGEIVVEGFGEDDREDYGEEDEDEEDAEGEEDDE